jgi:hypothetical protein
LHCQENFNVLFVTELGRSKKIMMIWNQRIVKKRLNKKLSVYAVESITHRKWLVTRQGQRSKTSYALQLFKPASLLQKNGWVLCYWNNRTLFVILPSLQRTQTAFYWAFFWRSSDFISSLSFWIAAMHTKSCFFGLVWLLTIFGVLCLTRAFFKKWLCNKIIFRLNSERN